MINDEQKGVLEDVSFHGCCANINLWYPRESTVKVIEIGLVDERPADNIRVSYDFDSNGWRIEQASVFGFGDDGAVLDEDWQEVAFVPAWRRANYSQNGGG